MRAQAAYADATGRGLATWDRGSPPLPRPPQSHVRPRAYRMAMRVFLHTKVPGKNAWKNSGEEFEQVPRVGDYIAPKHVGGWFKVTLVVWLPQSAATTPKDYHAEVFAVAHSIVEAHREADASVTWQISEDERAD